MDANVAYLIFFLIALSLEKISPNLIQKSLPLSRISLTQAIELNFIAQG
jgi:hypothetical protein